MFLTLTLVLAAIMTLKTMYAESAEETSDDR